LRRQNRFQTPSLPVDLRVALIEKAELSKVRGPSCCA